MHERRYTVVKPIASGGMGAVYLGMREGAEGFGRLVALKRAHASLSGDPGYRDKLVREATLASRIHHANVVSVVDVFERSDELWLVMEWIDGPPLSALRRRGSIDPGVTARIVLDAAAGLAAAHELAGEDGTPAGLRHGDVSPENVLVGKDGVARLADFGLAKSLDATLTATADRLLEGKLGYLAPEILAGKRLEERSDLYALAVVAWEAFAGARLFKGRSMREIDVAQRTPPALSTLHASLAPLDAVLARALAFEPERRHESVRAFLVELEDAARAAKLLATPREVAAHVLASSPVERNVAAVPREARTPPTGMVDPETPEVSARAGVFEDEPTPIVTDDVISGMTTLHRPAPPSATSALATADAIVALPAQPARLRRFGAGTAIAALAVGAGVFGIVWSSRTRAAVSDESPAPAVSAAVSARPAIVAPTADAVSAVAATADRDEPPIAGEAASMPPPATPPARSAPQKAAHPLSVPPTASIPRPPSNPYRTAPDK